MGGKIETASQNNSVSDCHRAVACTRYDSSKQKSSPVFDNFFVVLEKTTTCGPGKGKFTRRLAKLKPLLLLSKRLAGVAQW
ncbi:hypothetical protein OCT51_14495 [Halomonas sp. LR3S48]|uniref:hypothetical protein n=1 Tax=Halomonadaceae TaxID=28256 RepID=UPI0021E3A2B8|nr:hypothetical protein [Halomonas sp. LR3S48]UYG02389.1 hypothetical protein OCT51_14495 [Halomonas sp. LR3S48]